MFRVVVLWPASQVDTADVRVSGAVDSETAS